MTITIRIDPKLQKELDLYAQREGKSRVATDLPLDFADASVVTVY